MPFYTGRIYALTFSSDKIASGYVPFAGEIFRDSAGLFYIGDGTTAASDLDPIGGIGGDSGLTFVNDKSDFPAAVNGVITITGGAWMLTGTVDLEGDRIEFTGDAALLGTSSETATLKSTGLTSDYLLTTAHDLPMQNIEIIADKAISAVTEDTSKALDWIAVNFVDCAEVGVVSGYSNFIMTDSAFLNSADLTFDGEIATIGFSGCLFSLPTGTMITIPATATVSRRFRIIYSSFVVTAGNTGIDVNSSASVPVEGYILDTVNFSGGGTYTTGVAYTDNKSLFVACKGINNSAEIGFMTMTNNATATTISQAGTPVKAAGTTTFEDISQKFSHSNNRLTYTGAITRAFRVTVTATVSTTATNVVGLYIAKGNAVVANSENYSTTSSGGRSEGIGCQTVITLATNEYVELWVENASGANNITVEKLSVIAEALN